MPGHRRSMLHVAFSGDRLFLSNFYPHPFLFNGDMYATAEHAFQAAKCVDEVEAERVRQHPHRRRPSRSGAESGCAWSGTRRGSM